MKAEGLEIKEEGKMEVAQATHIAESFFSSPPLPSKMERRGQGTTFKKKDIVARYGRN